MALDTDKQGREERDWPKGHPSACDYGGEHYVSPPPPFAQDWPVGHPAHLGANNEAPRE